MKVTYEVFRENRFSLGLDICRGLGPLGAVKLLSWSNGPCGLFLEVSHIFLVHFQNWMRILLIILDRLCFLNRVWLNQALNLFALLESFVDIVYNRRSLWPLCEKLAEVSVLKFELMDSLFNRCCIVFKRLFLRIVLLLIIRTLSMSKGKCLSLALNSMSFNSWFGSLFSIVNCGPLSWFARKHYLGLLNGESSFIRQKVHLWFCCWR